MRKSVRRPLFAFAAICALAMLCIPVRAMDEVEWLSAVSTLSPAERSARLKEAIAKCDVKDCGLLVCALLSSDESVELLRPELERRAQMLVRPQDAEYLHGRLKKTSDPVQQDWLIDLLGYCGAEGFSKLQAIRLEQKDPRLRNGALRAMANLMLQDALPYVAEAASKAASLPEKEAALFAESRLRWQTGQLKDGANEKTAKPLVTPKDGAAKVREALGRGGTLLVKLQDLSQPDLLDLLKELDVVVPKDGGAASALEPCTLAVADFHRLAAYPMDFFYTDVSELVNAENFWESWGSRQIAPLRTGRNSAKAAAVIQEGVLGGGRVIFSGIKPLNVQLAAKKGRPERDSWIENLNWHHQDRDPADTLKMLQAREGFESQHVPWGKPLAGGPLNVCVITPGNNGRDAVEFAQRLEMKYEHLPFEWAAKQGFSNDVQIGRLTPPCWEILERVLAAPRDVIVLSGSGSRDYPINWPNLPAEYQETLLRLVRDKGLGLVVAGEPNPFSHMEAEQLKRSSAPLTPFENVERIEWGRGRIVVVPRLRGPLQCHMTPGAFGPITCVNPFDQWAQGIVLHIAWAAGHEPPVAVEGPPIMEGGKIVVPVHGVGTQRVEGELHAGLRNLFGEISAKGRAKFSLSAGESLKIPVELESFCSGQFFAEIVARDSKGASLGWNCFPLKIDGGPVIQDMIFDRPSYRPGDEMEISIKLEGAPPPDSKAELQISDHYGRLCGEAKAPLDPAAPKLHVKVGDPLWRYVRINLKIRRGDRLVAEFSKPWIVDVPPPRKEFPHVSWAVAPTCPPMTGMLKEAETDWLNADYERCLANGLRPWVLNFGGLGLGEHAAAMDYERNPCTLGPTFHQWRLNFIPTQVPELLRADVPAIIDQDEECLGGEYCFHPATLHEFRKFLQRTHGSIEKLNEIWQTSCKSWDEVMPLRLAQVKGRASLAPMVEHRMFMDTAYLHHVEFDRQVAESCGMSDVKLGLSTDGGGFADGWDIWKSSKMETCHIRQHTGNREKYRFWARSDMLLGRWCDGYYPDDVATGRFLPWNQLFHNSNVYATWSGEWGSGLTIWRGDMSLRDAPLATAEELREIWAGPATLIRQSSPSVPLIGIHYSRASQMASMAEWGGAAWPAGSSVEDSLEILGHQFRWISYEELEQGFCSGWQGRILFLPLSICLSGREASAVRRFAENGGTVVADSECGTRDGFGGAPGPGQLADIFGCEWIAAPAAPKDAKSKISLDIKGVPREIESAGAYARMAKVTDGKPNGTIQYGGQEFPAWIVKSFGKGRAVTLNFLPGRTSAAQAIMKALLSAAGVTRSPNVIKDGEEMSGVETFRFEDGPVEYSGIIHFGGLRHGWGQLQMTPEELKQVSEVEVSFPLESHLYDVREKKYLGHVDRIKMKLAPGRAYLFAHLPGKVEKVEADPSAGRAGNTATITVCVASSEGPSERHAVRARLFEPSGREREEYGSVVYIRKGTGEWKVPLAPNDPSGEWKILLTEAASGTKAEVKWEVQP